MSEDELYEFRKIKNGDLKVFENFYKSNYAELVRYSNKFVRDKAIAEEIAQEVFLYIWEKKKDINLKSSLMSYIFSAAKNRSINYIKFELPKIQSQNDISDIEIGVYDDEKDLKTHQQIERKVKQAINQLPRKCKEIFVLSRNAGLTYDEIAYDLGISKKTVENQMRIALQKLRVSLKPVLQLMNKY